MTRRVGVGAAVLEKAHHEFGEDRTADGSPSEYDFVSGPLAAALFVFRDFDNLSFDLVPAVRSYTIVDFAHDPDYWQLLDESTDP